MDLVLLLNEKINELHNLGKLIDSYGEKFAIAEHDYKVEISKEVMRLKDSGQAATLINLVVYGRPDVARLRLTRDLAQVMYESAKEKINILKINIRVLENQIDREWRS